jgi:hypothetical protein
MDGDLHGESGRMFAAVISDTNLDLHEALFLQGICTSAIVERMFRMGSKQRLSTCV